MQIGDTVCKFRYVQVAPDDFGMALEDILSLPDKELNSRSSLKKVTRPYKDGRVGNASSSSSSSAAGKQKQQPKQRQARRASA